jgi:hypothetical protein
MDLKNMASDVIDIEKNEFFRDKIRDLKDQAQASGWAKGRSEGMMHLLREQIQTKFGPLPKWAEERLSQGSPAQVVRWARKVLAAKTLESVLGKK